MDRMGRLALMVQSDLSAPVLCWRLQPRRCHLFRRFRLYPRPDQTGR